MAVGIMAFYRGDFVAARAHLEQSLCLCAPLQPPSPLFYGGLSSGSQLFAWLAQVLWGVGLCGPGPAAESGGAGAGPAGGAYPQSGVCGSLCRHPLPVTAGTWRLPRHMPTPLMALADAQGFALRLEQGRILRGWALAMQGDAAEGVAQIRQGLAAYQSMGQAVPALFSSLLAEAYGQAGQPEAGLQVLAEALTLVATTEVRLVGGRVVSAQGGLAAATPAAQMCPRRKPVSSRLSTWPAASRPRRWSCGRP